MTKNACWFTKKAFWIMIVLLAPTLFLLLYRICEGFAFIRPFILYLPSIIYSALIIWKKPCSLFLLPAGFLISLLFDPMWMLLLGKRYYFLFSSGNGAMNSELILLGFLYAFPFAIITLIIATAMKKDKEKPKT